MTNYLDTHIEWMKDLGVEILPLENVAPIETPDDLPFEIDLWFRYRMPNRIRGFQAVGYQDSAGGWLTPSQDAEYLDSENPDTPSSILEETATAIQQDRYPTRPVGFGSVVDRLAVVVETAGERAGWIYRVGYDGPVDSGPIVASLSQWFGAVRTLVGAGLFHPGSKHSQIPGIPAGASVQAPADTPTWLVQFGESSEALGDQRHPNEPPQLDCSIADLLPDFEWVQPLQPLSELWRSEPWPDPT